MGFGGFLCWEMGGEIFCFLMLNVTIQLFSMFCEGAYINSIDSPVTHINITEIMDISGCDLTNTISISLTHPTSEVNGLLLISGVTYLV